MKYVTFDSHKRDTWAVVEDEHGGSNARGRPARAGRAAGVSPGLRAWLLPEAAKVVGGSIDACHDYAAASLIPRGKEEELVRAMDRLVEESLR